LPPHPYRSLAYYERQHRALFAGRDEDVANFALLLDEPGTRVVVLHGETGVGKSSFLRAGLIPFLKEGCVGFRFLRDNRMDGQDHSMFVHSTNDPSGPLAQALCDFCARPLEFPTPVAGRPPLRVDLPDLLAGFLTSQVDSNNLQLLRR
jgi:hypothetical protein